MNKKQLTVTWIALGVFVLTLFNAQWTVHQKPDVRPNILDGGSTSYPRQDYATTSPLWDAPNGGELNTGPLILSWLGIGIVWGVLVLVLKTRKTSSALDKTN